MFAFKPKTDEVLNHWISIAENFSFQPQEFYERLEKELIARQIPGLKISRVEYGEGGLLSDKRIYLRLIRERLAFDTCAAPFGTDFFFSCRTVYSPAVVRLWHVLLVAALFTVIFGLLVKPLGTIFAVVAVFGLIITIAQIFQNTIVMELADLDSFLIKIPAIGPIYERWFRKDTYYRQDTRLVYLEIVPKLVQMLADELTASKGVKLIRQYQRAPILGDLYKPLSPPKDPV